MYLLLLTTIVGFLSVHCSILTKQIKKWHNSLSKNERKLITERIALIREQSTLSITRDFVKHAKLQRKINAIDENVKTARQQKMNNNFMLNAIVDYAGKIVVSIVMLLLTLYYRKVPVFIVESKYDLYPFGGLISFPNEFENSVSVHFWMICCASVARLIKA